MLLLMKYYEAEEKTMNRLEVFIRINLIDKILYEKSKLQKNKCNILTFECSLKCAK